MPRAFPGDEISIRGEHATLAAFLYVPHGGKGLVLFAHGSGSSRRSSRNQFVARVLTEAKLATLLLDLLTPAEDAADELTAEFRFNIPLLADRLLLATDWCARNDVTKDLRIGYFGASTGAAAALMAAARRPDTVRTVVSRGGRPDLAGAALRGVRVPVLLIVGSADEQVFQLNRIAAAELSSPVELLVIPRASHLFEEPGTLEQVAIAAQAWFLKTLANPQVA
jgi:putative phosphoribosyl transferase